MGEEGRPGYGLDSNVFIAVMVPGPTRAGDEEVKGAERVLRALRQGKIRAVASSMVFAEIKWVFQREGKAGFDIAEHTLRGTLRGKLTIVDVTPEIAVDCAVYRSKYYSRANPFSYVDGLVLATCLAQGMKKLITTDPHLLRAEEMEVIPPSAFEGH